MGAASIPTVRALKQTTSAALCQWEGELDDGRATYIRYRRGELSVGAGVDIDDAIRNSATEEALLLAEIGDCLDDYIELSALKQILEGKLVFPETQAKETTSTIGSPPR